MCLIATHSQCHVTSTHGLCHVTSSHGPRHVTTTHSVHYLISDFYPAPELLTFMSTSGATPPTQLGQPVPLPPTLLVTGIQSLGHSSHTLEPSFQSLPSRGLHTCQQALQGHNLTRSHQAPSSGRGAYLYLHHHQLIF